jgi:hypothetical protein
MTICSRGRMPGIGGSIEPGLTQLSAEAIGAPPDSSSELLAQVRADRALLPLAIEETLRWEGPVNVNLRTLARDFELGGVPMAAGSAIRSAVSRHPRSKIEDGPIHFTSPDSCFELSDSLRTNVVCAHQWLDGWTCIPCLRFLDERPPISSTHQRARLAAFR